MNYRNILVTPFAKNPKQKGDIQLVDVGFLAEGGTNCYSGGQDIHTGWDFNGAGGGDTDLGYPIQAVADGVVYFATKRQGYPSWGKLVIIYHPQFERWTRYAHLSTTAVKDGEQVTAGQMIGTCGKGWMGRYPAHLHFDVFKVAPPYPSYWNGTAKTKATQLANVQRVFEHPSVFFARNPLLKFAHVGSCPL